jgi:hypothetical protein
VGKRLSDYMLNKPKVWHLFIAELDKIHSSKTHTLTLTIQSKNYLITSNITHTRYMGTHNCTCVSHVGTVIIEQNTLTTKEGDFVCVCVCVCESKREGGLVHYKYDI